MAAPDQIRQGKNYDFEYALEGDAVSGFVYTVELKQYPGDTAAVSRTVTPNSENVLKVTITPAETATLAVGLWYLTMKSVDSDETIEESRRIQVTRPWT